MLSINVLVCQCLSWTSHGYGFSSYISFVLHDGKTISASVSCVWGNWLFCGCWTYKTSNSFHEKEYKVWVRGEYIILWIWICMLCEFAICSINNSKHKIVYICKGSSFLKMNLPSLCTCLSLFIILVYIGIYWYILDYRSA